MYIAIYAPGMAFNGDTIKSGKSLGGSETAAYFMAKELAAIGHQVVIFTNHQKTGRWDNVKYEWLGNCTESNPLGDRWHYVIQTPYDVCIMQRHPLAFRFQYNTKLNIWWLHDLALHRNNPNIQSQFINIDKIFTVSEFHKDQVAKVYKIDPKHIYATKNGVDYSFPAFNSSNENRIPKSLMFAARPERGLENLVGKDGIMEELTDCHLYVAGYDNTSKQMEHYYQYLWARCNELPNVTNLGALGKNLLYDYMKSIMLYVYPTTFKDTSCILALECQACGLPFVGPKIAALPETLKDGGANLLSNGPNNKVNKKKFIKTIRALVNNENPWRSLHKKCKNIHQSWSNIARDWSNLFISMLEEKSLKDQKRLFAHFERNSDIVAMQKAGATIENWPSLKENYSFYLNDDFKEHYKRYYEYEKNRGVNYGPENLTDNPRFECTCQMIKELKPKTILDYGCAHGHYVMNLAKRFPEIQFDGFDLEQTNIDKARLWAKQENVDNKCKFFCGEIDEDIKQFIFDSNKDCSDYNKKAYDIILCQELLEHTVDPREIINNLSKYLAPNGKFIVSVPYGPWESLGYEEHRGWRAHIHMLERADLFELFGKQPGYKIIAVPYKAQLGHYLLQFSRSDEQPIGEINYDRKIRQQAPKQTLSVCMIVKDGEFTLGKTLKSIRPIADEIIIGIDEKTSDETERVAKKFNAETFTIKSPLEIGFDAARNLTLEKATRDWIMWIDSDETFEQAKDFKKVLRNNPYNGYAISQHHYAIEPPALFKTDLPVRVFRNGLGMKFFGFVHEHPELEFNQGPGKIIQLGDVGIMHIGYATEAIRRKRFDRNFRLLVKDRDKYPDRKLGHFLWCRDIAHYIKYSLERNGGRKTPDIMEKAHVIIDTWRKLLEINDQRMLIDALPYYSEAVKIIGNGINYTISLDSSPLGRDLRAPKRINGTFIDTKDIKNLSDQLLNNNVSIYEEEYY